MLQSFNFDNQFIGKHCFKTFSQRTPTWKWRELLFVSLRVEIADFLFVCRCRWWQGTYEVSDLVPKALSHSGQYFRLQQPSFPLSTLWAFPLCKFALERLFGESVHVCQAFWQDGQPTNSGLFFFLFFCRMWMLGMPARDWLYEK